MEINDIDDRHRLAYGSVSITTPGHFLGAVQANLGNNKVLLQRQEYDRLIADFNWQIPEKFNIGPRLSDYWALQHPERLAIIHKTPKGEIENIRFAELREQSNRLANVLSQRGIERGDRVALLLPQCPEAAIAHIAVYKLGAVVLPLAMLFGVEALQYRLENSGAKALIFTAADKAKLAEIKPALPKLQTLLCIDGAGDEMEDFHGAVGDASSEFTPADTDAEEPALMIYTSGTTGPPKGALHAHRVLYGHLPGVQFSHDFFPQDDDVMWTPSDWAWAGGLLNIMLPALYFGVPLVAHKFEKFDAKAAWSLIGDLSIRNMFVPATALKMMRAVAYPGFRNDLKIRTLFSGGEAVGKGLQSWAGEVLGLKINEVYGQTECNLVLGSCQAIGVWKSGAIGKPVPGHQVAIVDDEGHELPSGKSGNIAVKRPDPVMFLEYWQRPEATENKFVNDWMLTGDQGFCDEDGYFFFVGRDDDIITSSGYRIGPGEVEDCLLGHPAVKIAAVVGKPDPVRTEIVKAFIVLNDGYEAGDELAAEISDYVKTRLAAHEYPREVAFKDELPMTTTGKVIRRLLRED